MSFSSNYADPNFEYVAPRGRVEIVTERLESVTLPTGRVMLELVDEEVNRWGWKAETPTCPCCGEPLVDDDDTPAPVVDAVYISEYVLSCYYCPFTAPVELEYVKREVSRAAGR